MVEPEIFFVDVPTLSLSPPPGEDSPSINSPSPCGRGLGGGVKENQKNIAQNTHKIAVYDRGKNNKEIVFCLHGLTRNARDFDALADVLSDKYRVIAVDMPGRGKSDLFADASLYSYPSYLADITYIVRKLGLSQLHWVGTSMGGILGMMIAGQFPGLIKSLTLNDIGFFIPAAGLARIAEYVGKATDFPSRKSAEEELRRRCAPYGINNEKDWQHLFTHGIRETQHGKFTLAYDPAIADNFAGSDTPPADVDLRPLWEAVKNIPTLLIRGENSDILTHETALEMQASHPNLTLLEIDGVGHAPALIDEAQITAIGELLKNHRFFTVE